MASNATKKAFAGIALAYGGCRIVWERKYGSNGPKTVRALLDRVERETQAALKAHDEPSDEINAREARVIEAMVERWWDRHYAETGNEGEPAAFFSAFSNAILTHLWLDLDRARPAKRDRLRTRLDGVQKALNAWHAYFDKNEKHADAALRALDAAERWEELWTRT